MQILKTIWGKVANAKQPEQKPTIVAPSRRGAHKSRGDDAETAACAFLQAQGLQLLARNYRTPGRGGGEIDLIMREADGTVVFVEVRLRQRADFGGAAASVDPRKQRRIVLAAQHYLMREHVGSEPPCRFDVVLLQGGQGIPEQSNGQRAEAGQGNTPAAQWIRAAFDAA